MKKVFLFFLIVPFLTFAQTHRIGNVSKQVAIEKIKTGDFKKFDIIQPQTKKATTDYSEEVADGVIFTLDRAKVNSILDQNTKQISVSLPYKSNGETVALDLIQVNVFSPDFRAYTDNGQDITNEIDFGKHYRGVISGNDHSLVSLSIFGDQISGFIASDEGNYTIGKMKASDTEHIIYRDNDLKANFELFCATPDDGIGYTEAQLAPAQEMDPGDEVDIYIEAGQSVYNANSGSLSNTIAFLTSLFAQSYVLYANDGILARTSNMLIWVSPDPYDGNNSNSQLNKFRSQTAFLNGDLGHLVEMAPDHGGIASGFSGICATNPYNSLCYSGLDGLNVPNVPTYSWNVNVITHEMGHLMGSRHTHACVWNGNNTAIDGCAQTEFGCPLPPIPIGGGTIMSYCNYQSVGINFNLGFGAQPRAVILNNINASGNCLDIEGILNPPVAVCKTHSVTLDANGNASITLSDIEGGSYDDDAIVSMSIDVTDLTCADVGFKDVTLTVTDTDGLTSTCISYVEVIDGTNMVITCPDDFEVTIPVGTTFELLDYRDQLTVTTDICNVNLADTSQLPYAGSELPEGVHEITLSGILNDWETIVSCTFEITVVASILDLEDNPILSSLVLHPNPAVESFLLRNPENLDLASLAIYDMTGRLTKLVDLKGMGIEKTIQVSNLSKSIYFLVIQDYQNKIVKKLILK